MSAPTYRDIKRNSQATNATSGRTNVGGQIASSACMRYPRCMQQQQQQLSRPQLSQVWPGTRTTDAGTLARLPWHSTSTTGNFRSLSTLSRFPGKGANPSHWQDVLRGGLVRTPASSSSSSAAATTINSRSRLSGLSAVSDH